MDVDGTMTDGRFTIDSLGNETKTFNVKDGMAIKLLKDNGVKTAIATGHSSEIVKQRAINLGIDYYFETGDKVSAITGLIKKLDINNENIAFIGDDLNDLPLFHIVGNKGCPSDACIDVKHLSNYICKEKGGYGAVREYAEYILREVNKCL